MHIGFLWGTVEQDLLGRLMRGWDNKIKVLLKYIRWKSMNWINPVQDGDSCLGVVKSNRTSGCIKCWKSIYVFFVEPFDFQ